MKGSKIPKQSKDDGDMKSSKYMSHMGVEQGNMNTHVEDYQKPAKDYAEEQFGKTLEYIERQDRFQAKECSGIKKQAYKGRYS